MKKTILSDGQWYVLTGDGGVRFEMANYMDLIAESFMEECCGIIVGEEQCEEDLFDLKNRKLGQIMQTCTNYRQKLIFTGSWKSGRGKAFSDLVRESNRTGYFRFLEANDPLLADLI